MKKKSLNSLPVFSAEQPEAKIASDSLFMQVDNNLSIINRLGIPTSSTDDLNASVSATNTAKLIYNSTLQKLRIYNPLTSSWTDANPENLADYYTKEQVDSLFAGVPTPTPLTFKNGLRVENGVVKLGLNLNTVEGGENVGALEEETFLVCGNAIGDYSALHIGERKVNLTVRKLESSAGFSSAVSEDGTTATFAIQTYLPYKSNSVTTLMGYSNGSLSSMYIGVDDMSIGVGRYHDNPELSSIKILDNCQLKGMVYDADYSLKGKADKRWIPDWGAVKAEIAKQLKVFSFTASGDGVKTRFRVPHGLSSPTSVFITPNSADALGKSYDQSVNVVFGGGVFAYIEGDDVVIENLEAENSQFAFLAGTNNLKWTLMVQ